MMKRVAETDVILKILISFWGLFAIYRINSTKHDGNFSGISLRFQKKEKQGDVFPETPAASGLR